MLRAVYGLAKGIFWKGGFALNVSKISARNQPETINRAIWKPFVVHDQWRRHYQIAQKLSRGDATDNIFRQCRLYSTMQFAHHAASLPAGDVIECGCWNGHSAVAIGNVLATNGFSERFHVFDSFEGGLSEFKPEDESFFALTDKEKQAQVKHFVSDFDFVKGVTDQFQFVELHRGWIPQVFSTFTPRPVRFVHVDVDMYEPTKAALEFFWPMLVEGGCIVVDDYNHSVFEGATKAVDEFLADKHPKLVYKVPMGSIAIMR